jgi:hypothetical protein
VIVARLADAPAHRRRTHGASAARAGRAARELMGYELTGRVVLVADILTGHGLALDPAVGVVGPSTFSKPISPKEKTPPGVAADTSWSACSYCDSD